METHIHQKTTIADSLLLPVQLRRMPMSLHDREEPLSKHGRHLPLTELPNLPKRTPRRMLSNEDLSLYCRERRATMDRVVKNTILQKRTYKIGVRDMVLRITMRPRNMFPS